MDNLGFDTRITVLGHVQRGGSPSAFDRLLVSVFTCFHGCTCVCVCVCMCINYVVSEVVEECIPESLGLNLEGGHEK